MTNPDHSNSAEPVAMIRGIRPYWKLYDARGRKFPEPLETFYGDYSGAWEQAQRWCNENGYYLSSYSDADDRLDRAASDEEQCGRCGRSGAHIAGGICTACDQAGPDDNHRDCRHRRILEQGPAGRFCAECGERVDVQVAPRDEHRDG